MRIASATAAALLFASHVTCSQLRLDNDALRHLASNNIDDTRVTGNCSLINACLAPEDCDIMSERAPDNFTVSYGVYNPVTNTSADILIDVIRDWAPPAADRLWQLAALKYSQGGAYYRVALNETDGFVVQYGMSGSPEVDACWNENMTIGEEGLVPVADIGNVQYTAAFSMGAVENSTSNCNATDYCALGFSVDIYINMANNSRLDEHGFMPFGIVNDHESRENIESIFQGYGEVADLCDPRSDVGDIGFCKYDAQGFNLGLNMTDYLLEGNDYVVENFPNMSIISDMLIVNGTDSNNTNDDHDYYY